MTQGLSQKKVCRVLDIAPRTIQRWRNPPAKRPTAQRPRPYNALTPPESAAVQAIIRSERHGDQSCRELSLTLLTGPAQLYVSPTTIWHYEKQLQCNGPRGKQNYRRSPWVEPVTDFATGPNMLWDWDISYLRTAVADEFLYLYAALDHFSRKVVAWLVSEQLTSEQVQRVWDLALVNENILALPQERWPKSLSDRGTQMRSGSTRRYFQKLGIERIFARPRTPNDNPEIESLFATVKTHPVYPAYFNNRKEAVVYFGEFFPWYNTVHPLTRLGMLTPEQVHTGQKEAVLAQRAALKAQSLARRQTYNLAQRGQLDVPLESLIEVDLSNVESWPCYSWQGPLMSSAKLATPID
jgi:transposase InsO family protein